MKDVESKQYNFIIFFFWKSKKKKIKKKINMIKEMQIFNKKKVQEKNDDGSYFETPEAF